MGKNLYTRAVTRSGRQTIDATTSYVSYASGDVTNYESIKAAIDGASGVIFAASASGKNKGGDPAHVDYLGVYNTAKACLECGVPKLAGTTSVVCSGIMMIHAFMVRPVSFVSSDKCGYRHSTRFGWIQSHQLFCQVCLR